MSLKKFSLFSVVAAAALATSAYAPAPAAAVVGTCAKDFQLVSLDSYLGWAHNNVDHNANGYICYKSGTGPHGVTWWVADDKI
jgi:hypothetical protein